MKSIKLTSVYVDPDSTYNLFSFFSKLISLEGQPPGVHPLALTSATQELFECRADEDVTRESPYKLLRKYAIIQDIKTRAAVSDFSPVEQIVLVWRGGGGGGKFHYSADALNKNTL